MSKASFLPTRLYGVLGWPLAQSLSPLLHNCGFQTLGIPSVYLRWEVPPQKLPAFMDSVRLLPISGCSITIPHKVSIMPLLDRIDETARLAGAVNTLFWEGETLCGSNTDVAGFLAPLEGMELTDAPILLLGAGGAARAIAAGLRLRGCRTVHVCTPSDTSHLPLAEEFGLTPLCWEQRYSMAARLVINATPLGMRGKHEDESPYDFSRAPCPNGLAYDIVYNPLETRFLREARATGRRCIGGHEMFYAQGDAQFRLWTGQPLPPAAQEALNNALGCTPGTQA